MNFKEAILTDGLSGTDNLIIVDESGNYSLMQIPEGVAFVSIKYHGLPIPNDAEHKALLDQLVVDATFGKLARLPGNKIKRRAT